MKYPYLRGALMDLWREASKVHADPVAAWASHRERSGEAPELPGGPRQGRVPPQLLGPRSVELIAAATIHTIKQHGPDRIIGFSPIPAMSMLSYAAGSRFLQLLGGVNLSFYDWYCDLPPCLARRSGASRPTWPRAPTGTTPSSSSRWARTSA